MHRIDFYYGDVQKASLWSDREIGRTMIKDFVRNQLLRLKQYDPSLISMRVFKGMKHTKSIDGSNILEYMK